MANFQFRWLISACLKSPAVSTYNIIFSISWLAWLCTVAVQSWTANASDVSVLYLWIKRLSLVLRPQRIYLFTCMNKCIYMDRGAALTVLCATYAHICTSVCLHLCVWAQSGWKLLSKTEILLCSAVKETENPPCCQREVKCYGLWGE